MFSFKLGLKNLTRQKRRNIITIFVIGFAFSIYIILGSVMDGIEEMSFDNIKDYSTGNIQLANPAYWQDKDKLSLDNLMVLSEEVKEDIQQTEGIIAISPELRFQASLNNGIDEVPVMGMGIETKDYNQVFATSEYFTEGGMFSPGEDKAILGVQLAELMDLGINDYLTLLVRTKDDTFNTMELEVSGLLRAPDPTINNGIVFVSLDVAQEVLEVGEGISMLSIKTDSQAEGQVIETLEKNFQQQESKINAYSWRESAKTVIALSAGKKGAIAVILGIVLFIGIIGIINNVVLSAIERTGEIGMMKALGMREWEIVSVFMVEATGIGVLGGLAGCLLGYIGVAALVKYGWDLSMYGGDLSIISVPIIDKVYGVWNYSTFSFLFILGVILAPLASMIPAYAAACKDPIKAIYHR